MFKIIISHWSNVFDLQSSVPAMRDLALPSSASLRFVALLLNFGLRSSVIGLSYNGKVKKFNSKHIREFAGITLRYIYGCAFCL